MDDLCQSGCSWPDDLEWTFYLKHGVGHADDKPMFCMKSFDGRYCRYGVNAALANGDATPGHPGSKTCTLMATGCAAYLRELRMNSDAQTCAQGSGAKLDLDCTRKAADAFHQEFIQPCERRVSETPLLPPSGFMELHSFGSDAQKLNISLEVADVNDQNPLSYNSVAILAEPSRSSNKGALIIRGFRETFGASEADLLRYSRELASKGFFVLAPNATMEEPVVERTEQLLFRGLYQALGRKLTLPAPRRVRISFSQLNDADADANTNASTFEISMASEWWWDTLTEEHKGSCAGMMACSSSARDLLDAVPYGPTFASRPETEIEAFLRDLFSWARLSTGILVCSFALFFRLLIVIKRRIHSCFKWLVRRWTKSRLNFNPRRHHVEDSSTADLPPRRAGSLHQTCLARASELLVKKPKRYLLCILSLLMIPTIGALIFSVARGSIDIDLVSEASFKVTSGKVCLVEQNLSWSYEYHRMFE